MVINTTIVRKNVHTFSNAFGLSPDSDLLIKMISKVPDSVAHVGVLLRDPHTGHGEISCYFPLDKDVTNQMFWTFINEKKLEAVPICTKLKKTDVPVNLLLRRLKTKMQTNEFYEMSQGDFTLRVHRSFLIRGVIEKFSPGKGSGFIKRNQRVYFEALWCNFENIQPGKEVAFIPVVSRQGLQARAIEEI
jgi:cold shock CspA family protein